MLTNTLWTIETGDGPLVAAAIHNGHEVRDEVARLMALKEAERLREEDPYTGEWTTIAPTRVVVHRSRFEVDLNRPREEALYRTAADAWGLEVWSAEPPPELVERSLAEHDDFYRMLRELLSGIERRHGRFVVFDLHSYNHRRDGPNAAPADPAANPQVNLGTGTMDRERWAPLIDRFVRELRSFPFSEGPLDVRENVKFRGRQLAQFVHSNFPRTGCALSIEVKKFFMDEWTGRRDARLFAAIRHALASTIPGLIEELNRS